MFLGGLPRILQILSAAMHLLAVYELYAVIFFLRVQTNSSKISHFIQIKFTLIVSNVSNESFHQK